MILKTILYDIAYVFINYFVAYIPFWWLRRLFYVLFGMKIGKGSRINMKCSVLEPWNITIRKNSIINEYSFIDGRGGLKIGNNCSISIYSTIYTASHKTNDENFTYYERETVLGDGVWIGARAIVLPGAVLNDYCVLGAGSLATSMSYDSKGIYAGTPAKKVNDRDISRLNDLHHNMFFR